MTPQRRDRNLLRARRITAGIAGASLAATGLFAGLAASKAKGTATHAAAATTTATRATTETVHAKARRRQTTTETETQTLVVTPQDQAPVASSGGS